MGCTFFESLAPHESISKELYFTSRPQRAASKNSSVTAIVVKVTRILVTGEEGDIRHIWPSAFTHPYPHASYGLVRPLARIHMHHIYGLVLSLTRIHMHHMV